MDSSSLPIMDKKLELPSLPQDDVSSTEERLAKLKIKIEEPDLISTDGEVLVLKEGQRFFIYSDEEFGIRWHAEQNDTMNFFKSRLTSGSTTTPSLLDDMEELKVTNPDLDTITVHGGEGKWRTTLYRVRLSQTRAYQVWWHTLSQLSIHARVVVKKK